MPKEFEKVDALPLHTKTTLQEAEDRARESRFVVNKIECELDKRLRYVCGFIYQAFGSVMSYCDRQDEEGYQRCYDFSKSTIQVDTSPRMKTIVKNHGGSYDEDWRYLDRFGFKRNLTQDGIPLDWLFENFESELMIGIEKFREIKKSEEEEQQKQKDNQESQKRLAAAQKALDALTLTEKRKLGLK